MIKAGDEIGAPGHLAAHHDLDAFDSGEPLLDDWLRRRALGNDESGASRSYVVCARRRVVNVLHAFQKKSRRGMATPKAELDLIAARLARAKEDYVQWLRSR